MSHKPECVCIKCDPSRWQTMNQRRPLQVCSKHNETKIRRPSGCVQCRSCVREYKAARKKKNAKWLRYESQKAEVYRRAAEVRATRPERPR